METILAWAREVGLDLDELTPFDEWTEVFGSERLTGALLDRLTHRVHILEMNGESYQPTGRHHALSRRFHRRIDSTDLAPTKGSRRHPQQGDIYAGHQRPGGTLLLRPVA